MKAVLLMDMPKGCNECGFSGCDGDRCFILYEKIPEEIFKNDEKLDGCLLREVPKRMDVSGHYTPGDVPASYKVGWNDCLKKILS